MVRRTEEYYRAEWSRHALRLLRKSDDALRDGRLDDARVWRDSAMSYVRHLRDSDELFRRWRKEGRIK